MENAKDKPKSAHNRVARWSRSYAGDYLSTTDLILMPFNAFAAHWTLIVVELKEKRIVCYDSLQVRRWAWPGACFCSCATRDEMQAWV